MDKAITITKAHTICHLIAAQEYRKAKRSA